MVVAQRDSNEPAFEPSACGQASRWSAACMGVPERVAMSLTGHKSCAVFDRYHIVSPANLREVAPEAHGHIFGHTRAFRA